MTEKEPKKDQKWDGKRSKPWLYDFHPGGYAKGESLKLYNIRVEQGFVFFFVTYMALHY